MDEYSRLTTLNAIVKGWAEYYKYTSLLVDIEEITRYTWFRYLGWLLKKHKGSRKHNLITAKTKVIHNRTRWTASIREGEKVLEAYQWLPTRKELQRRRYYQKGKDGFPHPYLMEDEPTMQDYPMGETGPDAAIYTALSGQPAIEPHAMNRLNWRNSSCGQRCGMTSSVCVAALCESLRVHHKKGTKSHSLDNLETLCLKCHKADHGYRQAQ